MGKRKPRVQRTIDRALRAPEVDIHSDPPDVPADFSPPKVQNTLNRKTMEDMMDEYPRSALTGILDTERWIVYADPRRVRHHNGQLGVLKQMGMLPERFIPFLWSTFTMGDSTRAEYDMPRSAGGAFQWVSRHREKDIEYISTGDETTEYDIYAGAYVLRLLGVPAATEASIEYLDTETRDQLDEMPDQLVRELRVERQTIPLEDLYRKLRVAGVEPAPLVNRRLDAQDGVVVTDG